MEIAALFLVPIAAWYLLLGMDGMDSHLGSRLERFFLACLIGSYFGLLLLIVTLLT